MTARESSRWKAKAPWRWVSLILLGVGWMLVSSSFDDPLAEGAYPFPNPGGMDRDLSELPVAFALVIVAAAVFLIFLVSLVVGRRWLVTSYGLTAIGVGGAILAIGAVWMGSDMGDITVGAVSLPAFTRLVTGLTVGAVGLFCWYPAWEDTQAMPWRDD